jgi:hypothetical protein
MQEITAQQSVRTDGGDSSRQNGFILNFKFFRFDGESAPTPPPVAQAFGRRKLRNATFIK